MKNHESLIAEAVCAWWAYEANRRGLDHRLLAHFPNEGKRTRFAGWKMKLQGLRAGMPDFGLFVPTGLFHGLFLELKAPGGRVTPAQSDMLDILRQRGYVATVAYGTDEAIKAIEGYLGTKKHPL